VVLAVLVALVACHELNARIELSAGTYRDGDELIVSWELSAAENVHILSYGTPLEGEWNSYMFSIVSESRGAVEYQGRLYKRATPTLNDYVAITPATPRSGQLVLSEGYKFFTEGRYQITMRLAVVPLVGEAFYVLSNTVELHVVQPNIRPIPETETVAGSRAVTFNGCSSSEQTTTNTAINNAITASQNAENYLSGSGSSSSTAYTKWFGTYSSSNWKTVQTHFVNINNLLASKNFGIDCTCNQPGTYAYVYPSDPKHTIYLCPVFWTAATGMYSYNSQPGTLSHESSHFNDVAATGDYQYGVAGCLDLASNPSTAIKNADSHEYFQESNPK